MLEDLAAHAHQRILANGGVTLNLQGHEPSSGYAFSPYPELERVLPAHGLQPQHIHQYMTDNHAALAMPGNHLGAWHDTQSGNVFLDVSHVGPAHPDTISEAKKQNQLAVFDLANFQEIPTGLERSRDVTSAWDWNVAEQQFAFPSKHVSDDPESILRAIALGYRVKPHIPLLEPPEWRVGAVNPEWMDEWIRRNGPYVMHRTTRHVKPLIQQHGLIPWDAPGMRSMYSGDMKPRPNHVYVSHPGGTTPGRDDSTIFFDLRKLDPERIHSDEDPWFDNHTPSQGEPHLTHPERIEGAGEPNDLVSDAHGSYKSYGEWADKHGLNEPHHVAHSLNEYGTLAIEGGVDPAAIVPSGQVRDWHEANGTTTRSYTGLARINPHNAVPYNYPIVPHVQPAFPTPLPTWADDNHSKWQDEAPSEIDLSQISDLPLWQSKMTQGDHSLIYTREAGRRLNMTNSDGGDWHFVSQGWVNNFLSPEFKPQNDQNPMAPKCYFHPLLPAVAEEGGAPMCQGCLDRYHHALLATRPDMRQAPSQMLSRYANLTEHDMLLMMADADRKARAALQTNDMGEHMRWATEYHHIADQLKAMTGRDPRPEDDLPNMSVMPPDHDWSWESAWIPPEGFGTLGPQSPEEHALTMLPPTSVKECPGCKWHGRMGDMCPMCGFDLIRNQYDRQMIGSKLAEHEALEWSWRPPLA